MFCVVFCFVFCFVLCVFCAESCESVCSVCSVFCFVKDSKTGVLETLAISIFRKKTGKSQTFHVCCEMHVVRYLKIKKETAAIRLTKKSDRVFWQRRRRCN